MSLAVRGLVGRVIRGLVGSVIVEVGDRVLETGDSSKTL